MYERLTSLIPEIKKISTGELIIKHDGVDFAEKPEPLEKLYNYICGIGMEILSKKLSYVSVVMENEFKHIDVSQMDTDSILCELYYLLWQEKWLATDIIVENCKNGYILKLLERLKEIDE